MALKICAQCHEKVEDDWILCKYCNVPIKNNTTEFTAPPEENNASPKAKVLIGVIAVIVVLLILYALFK